MFFYIQTNNDWNYENKFKYGITKNPKERLNTDQHSYKTLYKYSPELGLLVSICQRNSFNQYISHLKPYYTKLELIKFLSIKKWKYYLSNENIKNYFYLLLKHLFYKNYFLLLLIFLNLF